MSELVLLVVRGRRWNEDCGRLARGCRLYWLFQNTSRYCNVTKVPLKLSYPVPATTRKISRSVSWWNSLRSFLSSPRNDLPSLNKTRGCYGVASFVTERDVSVAPKDEPELFAQDERCKTEVTNRASLFLQKQLGFDAEKADQCVKEYKGFAVIDPAEIPRNYESCRDTGFSEIIIRQNPGILSYPNRILTVKIQSIKNMNIEEMDNAIPLFALGIATLRAFSNKIKYETLENKGVNRITYLAEQLQCPVLTVCQIVAKHHFMRSVAFSKLQQVLKIMLDSHVAKGDIINDVWAFRYSPDIITERLKRVTEAGVYPVKPWMIRCPEVTLSRRIRKELRRRSVLGVKGTIVEYLSERFDCEKEKIREIIGKYPKVAQVSGPKIKRVVDFLLENKYTVEHVMRVPRVLFHSLETMEERLNELKKYKHRPNSLIVFCKSKQQYDAYLTIVKLKWLMTDSK